MKGQAEGLFQNEVEQAFGLRLFSEDYSPLLPKL
jgi:hypothetical protein